MAKYPDLKSYLQENYIELFTSEIQKFVDGNFDGGGFHSINVLSLLKHKIENVEVKALTCHDAPGPIVKMDVGLSADIVELGLGTKEYEADRKCRWFTVYLQGILRDGLVDVQVLDVKEFHNGKFEKESALDQFLVPYIYTATLEETADDFTEFYCCDAVYDGYKLPVAHILDAFEIKYYLADLPDNCFGRMYFRRATATVYETVPYVGEVKKENEIIEPGTMLISRDKYYLGSDGTQRLTIAHEIIHWYLHQKYFKLLALLDDQSDMMSCEVEPSRYEESMTMAQKAHWYAEWQANALAIRIAMPLALMRDAFAEISATEDKNQFPGDIVENALCKIAEMFDVPKFAAKQRARQLGLEAADGAFLYVDRRWYEPFVFENGNLDQHQTYVIDRAGYERIYNNNADLAQLIDSGKYIYLGYVVCINDPKYITVDFIGNRAELKLSDYAREHADECCLKFSFKSTSYLREMQQKRLNAFWEVLTYHMDRKNITVEQLAERSELSDTTIKNYRAGKKTPPIENVMAVCIGLNLPRVYSEHLLKTCSYTLGNSPRDRAYNLCLDYSEGTITQWNMILEKCHQPGIPDRRNQKTA